MSRPLADEVVTARMSRWMLVGSNTCRYLFGFADEHSSTGGLAWTISTRIVEFDEYIGRARTESGRIYKLDARITDAELDEEGRIAKRLLTQVAPVTPSAQDAEDAIWLTACKMSRHLGLPRPALDSSQVRSFLLSYRDEYLAVRTRARSFVHRTDKGEFE